MKTIKEKNQILNPIKNIIFNGVKIVLTSLVAALACTGIIYAATTVGTNISTTGTLDVTGVSTLTGNTSITGTLDVTGNFTFTTASSTGIVKFPQINSDTGAISFGDDNITTTGNIIIGDACTAITADGEDLCVDGDAGVDGGITIVGDITVGNADTDDPQIIFTGTTGNGKWRWDESVQAMNLLDDSDVVLLSIDLNQGFAGSVDALGSFNFMKGTLSSSFGSPTVTVSNTNHASAGIFISKAENENSHRVVSCVGERDNPTTTLTAAVHADDAGGVCTGTDDATLCNDTATWDTDCDSSDPGGDGEDSCIGFIVYNTTDSSDCVITDNTQTTITCTLAGGTDNDWDANDVVKLYSSIILMQNQGCYGEYKILDGSYKELVTGIDYIMPAGVAGFGINSNPNVDVPVLAGVYGKVQTSASATTGKSMALYAGSNSNSGTNTVNYGLYLEEQTAGTTNYQIFSADSSNNETFAVLPDGTIRQGTQCIWSNGGPSIIGATARCSKYITLTAAEVNALNAVGISVAPAYGADILTFLDDVFIIYDYTTAAFGGVDGTDEVCFSYTGGSNCITEEVELVGLIDQTNDELRAVRAEAKDEEVALWGSNINVAIDIIGSATHDGTTGGNDASFSVQVNYRLYVLGLN